MTGGAGTVAGVLSPDRKVTGSNPAFCHFFASVSFDSEFFSVSGLLEFLQNEDKGALVELPGAQSGHYMKTNTGPGGFETKKLLSVTHRPASCQTFSAYFSQESCMPGQ